MQKFLIFAAACVLAVPLQAKTIATVNGQEITQEQLDSFVSLLLSQGAQDTPELRDQVKEELINRTIIVQAAEKAGIDKQPDVQQELDLARQGILVRALWADYLKKHPVTDEAIQKEYDALKKDQADSKEYKLRHILLEDEEKANDLLKKIKDKAIAFSDAAKTESVDSGSGSKGGDLGWAPSSNFVPEFANAVEAMDAGDLSDKPVKSQFGWHIIEVEDVRPVEFPELQQVKPQLAEMLRQQQLSDYQDSLLKSAKIEQ